MNKLFIIFFLMFSSVCFSQNPVLKGLVAYYPFNGNANDSSGNVNNPVFNNATLTTDRFGNANSAYAFNGRDSYMQIPNSPSLNPSSQISLCAWVKVHDYYTGPCRGNSILMKGDDEAFPAYKLRIDENSYPGNYSCGHDADFDHEFFYGYGQSLEQNYYYPWIKKDQWYYVVYTYDGKTANLYVDCKLVKSTEFKGLDLTNADDVYIGRTNEPGYPYWFNGVLDDIKIYNRALTEAEINALSFMITKSNDTSLCKNTSVQLYASGGSTYLWLPSSSLSNANISNPIATPSSTTTYYVTVTDANKCTANDSIKITVNRLPAIIKSSDTSLCKYTSVQLVASGGSTYLWSPASSLNNANIFNPIATPIATTTYFVTVTDVNKCTANDSIKITVNSLPAITKSTDTSLCKNTSVQLYASGGNSYIWSPSSSLNNANIFNPIASPISTTTYYVTVTDANKCSAKDSIKITVNPLPAITKSKDTSLCRNTLVQLFASGGSIYLWSPSTSLNNANISNPIATPASTTTYNVTVTDANKCSNNDSISITVTSSSVFTVSPDQDICKKDSNQLFAAGGTTYLWSPSSSLSNPNIANPIATPDATTVYSVKIKDNNCNDSTTLSTKISVLPLPAIKASKTNDINCSNNSSQLNVTGGKQYLWQPGISLTDSNIYNPIAKPLITTTYHVTGVDINGCKNFDSVTVKINFNTTGNYNLPNAFTPNGDGINDCFGLKFWVDVTELDFSIYNRFGQRVFHTANAADCWDGKYKGIPQNIGIYISVIKAKTACGVIDRKSEIMLLR